MPFGYTLAISIGVKCDAPTRKKMPFVIKLYTEVLLFFSFFFKLNKENLKHKTIFGKLCKL